MYQRVLHVLEVHKLAKLLIRVLIRDLRREPIRIVGRFWLVSVINYQTNKLNLLKTMALMRLPYFKSQLS